MNQYYDDAVSTLTTWAEGLASSLPNFLAAFAVVSAFSILAGPISRLVGKAILKMSDSDAITRLSRSVSRVALMLIGLFIALGILGLDKTVTSLLAGAGVIGIALGFAFQDIAANFIAGVTMGVRHPFAIGDVIETNGHQGTVKQLNLRNTIIETFAGQRVIVPNKEVLTHPLINYHTTGLRRVEIEVGISYDDDIEKASQVVKDGIAKFDFLAEDKDVEVVASAFGGSSIDLKVRYWIPSPGDKPYPAAVHEGVVAIKKAFDAEGIDIPFPIRTLKLGEAESSLVEDLSQLSMAPAEPNNGEAKRTAS